MYDSENRSQDIAIEAQDELDEDDKGPTVLKSEIVKAIRHAKKEGHNRDNNIPVDLLKELGDNGLKIMTALVNKIYTRRDWLKEFLDGIMHNKEKPSKEMQ